jgi:hypothetical protein
MKRKRLIPAALFCALALFPTATASVASVPVPGLQQQIPSSEYAALVDFYHSTNGDSWDFHFCWLDPNADSWMGVTVSGFEYERYRHYRGQSIR